MRDETSLDSEAVDPWIMEHVPRGHSGPVRVLNEGYAFTRAHVERFFESLSKLEVADVWGARYADDVLLSYSGEGAPKVHSSGSHLSCPSAGEEGVALFTNDSFYEERLWFIRELERFRRRSAPDYHES